MIQLDLEQIILDLDEIIFLVDEDGVYRQYWAKDKTLLWMPPEAFIGKSIADVTPEPLCSDALHTIQRVLHENKAGKLIYRVPESMSKDRDNWYRVKVAPLKIQDQAGKRLLLLIIGDCTEEEMTKQQSHIYEALITQNWEAIRFTDMDLTIQYVNPALERLYGYDQGELIGKKINLFTNDFAIDQIKQKVLANGSWSGETIHARKDGTLFEVFLSVQLVYDPEGQPMGFISQSKDISLRKETASKLKSIIEERETLLREIHHRVKNNLQVITSLLRLQASTLQDANIKAIFQQSQYRINAMSMIHETLYRSANFSNISYDRYIQTLANYLLLSMKGVQHKIELDISVEQVLLNIDTAVPLGLLINEIMTNALKYGIPNHQKGHIYIRLRQIVDEEYELLIGDNGVGYGREVTFQNTQSLGLKLIHNLVRQLNGSIDRNLRQQGTHYCIKFVQVQTLPQGHRVPAGETSPS